MNYNLVSYCYPTAEPRDDGALLPYGEPGPGHIPRLHQAGHVGLELLQLLVDDPPRDLGNTVTLGRPLWLYDPRRSREPKDTSE